MKNPQKIINVGIFAHVDAGKTTITENMLFRSGAVKVPGRVDQGTAKTDDLAVEKERGISVRTSCAVVQWRGVKINIIDTPGHIDFSSEVERALLAPDAAVLVISAVEGIQAQTLILWEVLKKRKIPLIIFINKIDRLGTNIKRVIELISNDFKIQPLVLQEITGQETREAAVINSLNASFNKGQ